MENDFRPHLLIPETEVDLIPNERRGFSEDLGRDYYEHGSKLSSGLQEIVSTYTKVQSNDSLNEEDIRVFEVVLPDGEKFSNNTLREFLQQEGMDITSVRDERHATVVTSKDRFNNLVGRVNNYRDNHKVKKFQYIDEFRTPLAIDKQSRGIKELLEQLGEQPIDVEIREELLSFKIGEAGQIRAEDKLINKIRLSGGKLMTSPYALSDGTHIIRAEIPLNKIEEISSDTVVCHVAPTAFYGTAPASCFPANNQVSLDFTVDLSELPVVAVLDTGVDFPDSLEPVIMQHWVPEGASEGDKVHGTSVASKVAFLNVGEQMTLGTMTPRVRIIDCNIRGEDPESARPGFISNKTIITRIQAAVKTFKDITKIFNFSSADIVPIQGDEISYLGYELDVLALKEGVEFVLAAGNHDLYKTEDSLQAILDDDEIRIAAPSDSMLNISVGAIVGADHNHSISKSYDIAPYSRIGPGFQGMRKPDIVTFAGTLLKNGSAPPDPYSMMLTSNNRWAIDAGTSFAAPVVAGDLAQIAAVVPDNDILLAKTLLFHGAQMPIQTSGKEKIKRDDAAFYGDIYGRGISNPDVSRYSTSNRVTFVHRGSLNKQHKQHVKFLMPKICEEKLDMSKRDKKLRVVVTCVTQSPIDNTKGADYLGAYVDASLHSINGNGKQAAQNPKETDGRKKWDTCFHFEKPYSSFQGGDWEIWLELHTKYDIKETDDIEYALAISIEDLTESLNLYDAVIAEAHARFPAIQQVPVRIPVRQ